MVNTGASRSTAIALAMSFLFLALLIINVITNHEVPISSGFTLPALFTTLLILILSFTSAANKYVLRIFSHHTAPIISVICFALFWGLLIVGINLFVSGLFEQHSAPKMTPLLIELVEKNWNLNWLTLTGLWWILFTPAVCGYLADISKGYSIRAVILAIVFLPVILYLILRVSDHYALMFSIPFFIEKIIALILSVIFLTLLLQHHRVPNLIMGYFPKNGVTKHRDRHRFYPLIFKYMVVQFYLFFVLGLNGLTLLVFAFTYPFVICVLLMMFASISVVARTKG